GRDAAVSRRSHRGPRRPDREDPLAGPLASESHRERLQSPQRETLAVLWLVRDELELREPPHERVDRNLPFHAREGSAEAEGNAPMKGITISPLPIVRPPIVMSVLGMRAVRCTGPS